MADDEFTIRPKSVPLTHRESAVRTVPPVRNRWAPWAVLTAAIIGAGIIFALLPEPVIETPPASSSGAGSTTPDSSRKKDSQPPPFEATQREQMRQRAQSTLDQFVRLQLELEESYNVAGWAQDRFDTAVATANEGDEQFMAARYEPALERYQQARDTIEALLEEARTTFDRSIADARTAVLELREADARTQLATALTVRPESAEAQALSERADDIPALVRLLAEADEWTAENEWRKALHALTSAHDIAPDLPGLAPRMDRARAEIREIEYQELLSRAFTDLNAGRYDASRKHFDTALSIKRDDPVALGGLQQVQAFTEVREIDRLRKRAEADLAHEDWEAASAVYDQILTLEPAVQFAREGKAYAERSAGIEAILRRVIESPEKLSSTRLFEEARKVHEQAVALENPGPRIRAQTARVGELLNVYSQSVTVRLTSDNATEVAITSHGKLGTFSETEVELRPGRYTFMGSRDGCRDVRKDVLVLPDIGTIDIRCRNTL